VVLDHREVLHGFVADGESQRGSNGLQLKELWAELVPDRARLILLIFGQVV
jgi:hypothetical protein